METIEGLIEETKWILILVLNEGARMHENLLNLLQKSSEVVASDPFIWELLATYFAFKKDPIKVLTCRLSLVIDRLLISHFGCTRLDRSWTIAGSRIDCFS